MKRKIFLFILIFLLIFIIFCFIIYSVFFKISVDNTNINFVDSLEVEVYSEVVISDLVESIDGEIIEDILIDTSELGDREVSFLYHDNEGIKKLGTFTVRIMDSTKPMIFINNSYVLLKGSEEVLLDTLMSVDNYDSKPIREIIGNYDISKVGEYNLTYKVTDSSGNTNKKDFVLKVIEDENGNNSYNDNNYTDFKEIVRIHKNKNTMIGIDVSKWQGEIDFKKVKEASAEFVMIRIGYQDGIDGESVIDPYFEKNIEDAIENDLKIGIYYYSHANDIIDARKQALWVVNKLSSYEIDLPVVFDWENWKYFNLYNISLYDINQIASTFMSIIEKYNYEFMLYGSKYYLENIWDVSYKNIWLAHYTNKTDYVDDCMMWQLCNNGKIDGINGYVDIDVLYL